MNPTTGVPDNADHADLQAGAALHGAAVDRLHAQEQLQGARTPHALPHDGRAHILIAVVRTRADTLGHILVVVQLISVLVFLQIS